MDKRAYDFKDPLNPANNNVNKIVGAVGGGLLAGAGSEIIGRLLGFSKKRRWLMNGMAMAGGGFGGYKLGDELTDKMWYPLEGETAIGFRMPSKTRREISKVPNKVVDMTKDRLDISFPGSQQDTIKRWRDEFASGKIRPVSNGESIKDILRRQLNKFKG